MNLKDLSASALHEKLLSISAAERKLALELLHHLREFDRRRLYADRGHSSLFEYVVRELKYSESAAQRRIFAMRALRELPEFEAKVESGELKVTQLAQIQSFVRMEEKQGKRVTLAEKRELFESAVGKSARETEKFLAGKNPEAVFQERTRAVTATHTELRIVADEELMTDLAAVRDRFAHRLPAGASMAEVIGFLARRVLESAPEKKAEKPTSSVEATPASTPPESPLPASVVASRYLPAGTCRAVWKRDGGQCVYVSEETGRTCGSRHRLQIDHIRPHALNGSNVVENLRLLCFAHNQSEARRIFGVRE